MLILYFTKKHKRQLSKYILIEFTRILYYHMNKSCSVIRIYTSIFWKRNKTINKSASNTPPPVIIDESNIRYEATVYSGRETHQQTKVNGEKWTEHTYILKHKYNAIIYKQNLHLNRICNIKLYLKIFNSILIGIFTKVVPFIDFVELRPFFTKMCWDTLLLYIFI